MIQIEFIGFDKLLKLTDAVRTTTILDKAVDRMAQVLRDETKKLPPVSASRTGYSAVGIPVDTGRLRQSIQKQKVALMAADVFAATSYARHVHQGTGSVPARPFFVWAYEISQDKLQQVLNEAVKEILTP